MKCPKCGYNSFEFLDSCKKCGNDLVAFKVSLGILPVILPFEEKAVEAPAAAFAAEAMPGLPVTENIAGPAVDDSAFSWDEPAAEAAPKPEEEVPVLDLGPALEEEEGGEMFSFEEPPADSFGEFSFEEVGKESSLEAAALSAAPPAVEEDFADLLELNSSFEATFSAPAADDAPREFDGFAETGAAVDAKEIATAPFDAPQEEFEMEDFFAREEIPAPAEPAKSGSPEQEGVSLDEFDFLFGTDEGEKEKTAR